MDTPSNTIAIPETGYTTTIKAMTSKVGLTDSPYVIHFADGSWCTLLKRESLPKFLEIYKGRGDYAVYALVERGEGDIDEEYGQPLMPIEESNGVADG